MSAERDAELAFLWHAIETALVGILAIVAIIGFIWSWKHRPARKGVLTSREKANRTAAR
jgi:hypothetical protein